MYFALLVTMLTHYHRPLPCSLWYVPLIRLSTWRFFANNCLQPGSILVTRVTSPPGSADDFDQINLRIEPVISVLEAQQAAGIQPQDDADLVSQPQVNDEPFFPDCEYHPWCSFCSIESILI